MRQRDLGLTQTYKLLAEPLVSDPAVLELRALHESVDRAVLDAYGWPDVALPSPNQPAQIKDFEDLVADGLFALNAERAVSEPPSYRPERQGPQVRKAKAGRGPSTVSARRQALEPAKRRTR